MTCCINGYMYKYIWGEAVWHGMACNALMSVKVHLSHAGSVITMKLIHIEGEECGRPSPHSYPRVLYLTLSTPWGALLVSLLQHRIENKHASIATDACKSKIRDKRTNCCLENKACCVSAHHHRLTPCYKFCECAWVSERAAFNAGTPTMPSLNCSFCSKCKRNVKVHV